jgi:ankyrin repeat protein
MDATQQLFDAVKRGDAHAIRLMLKDDPSLAAAKSAQGLSPVLTAVYHGHREVAGVLVDAGYALDLFEAAAMGRLERVRELIAAQTGSVNSFSSDGFTPLMLAAYFGHPDAVRFLLEWNADVSAVARNTMRVMPLHSAVAARQVAIAEALLKHGADVNARQAEGVTPLHQAAECGQVEMIRLLLSYGADPMLTMNNWQTPVDVARAKGHVEAVALLGRR